MSNVVLVTGVMGSGKTLKVVADLVADIELNESRAVEEKRTYFSDITGLRISGIEQSPQDWRTTPDHSYIIYDEAQLNPMFARKRGASHKAVQELTLSRKRGHKIIFITQAPNRLHQDILDVVGEHYHLHRPYGAKLATCYMWRNMVALRPMSRENQSKAETKFLFQYPKKCYDLYESAQVQDDGFKTKIPFRTLAPILGFGGVLALCGYVMFWGFSSDATQNMIKGEKMPKEVKAPTASAPVPASAVYATASAPVEIVTTVNPQYAHLDEMQRLELKRVSYVLQIKDVCIAGNSIGERLDITQKECLEYMKGTKKLIPSYIDVGKALQPQTIATQSLPTTQQTNNSVVASAPVGGV